MSLQDCPLFDLVVMLGLIEEALNEAERQAQEEAVPQTTEQQEGMAPTEEEAEDAAPAQDGKEPGYPGADFND